MKTSNRYTKTRGAVQVDATARAQVHPNSELVEVVVFGRVNGDRQFRILCNAEEAALLAYQLKSAADKIAEEHLANRTRLARLTSRS